MRSAGCAEPLKGCLPRYRWAEHKLVPLLRGLSTEAAVLDLGCGAGQMLQLLKDHGFANASGLDVSQAQVRLAADRGLHAVTGDAFEHLASARAAFDAITALDLVEHFDKAEQIRLFDGIYAALRPGGRLIIETPNHLERRLNSPSAHFVYIADNPSKDFTAPHELGWKTVRVKRTAGLYSQRLCAPQLAMTEITDLELLPGLIAHLT